MIVLHLIDKEVDTVFKRICFTYLPIEEPKIEGFTDGIHLWAVKIRPREINTHPYDVKFIEMWCVNRRTFYGDPFRFDHGELVDIIHNYMNFEVRLLFNDLCPFETSVVNKFRLEFLDHNRNHIPVVDDI